jgi:hypothetical protein
MWYFDPGYCPNVGMETTVLLIEEETGNFYPVGIRWLWDENVVKRRVWGRMERGRRGGERGETDGLWGRREGDAIRALIKFSKGNQKITEQNWI